jgi:trimethylamine--corrinoid protein Co-methyltransferase
VIDRFREGVLVKPYERLNAEQLTWLDQASLSILEDPGIWCYNERAATLLKEHGARVWEEDGSGAPCWRVSFQSGLIKETVAQAPSRFVLGARIPENRLLIDAEIPRVYFGTGSEANIWLDAEMEDFVSKTNSDVEVKVPRYTERRGSTALLSRAAHL